MTRHTPGVTAAFPRGRREIAIGLGSYAAYLAVRAAVVNPAGRMRAERNAQRILAFERRLGVDVEQGLQRWFQRMPRLKHGLSASYAALNVTGSVAWLMWLYGRQDAEFRHERRIAVAAMLAALPVFALVPTAPPRMLDGFEDTLAGGGFNLDHPLLLRFYNPISALPSQHMAFAVVTGVSVARRLPRGQPVVAVGYPAVVAFVVLVTANHFVVDVVSGTMLGVAVRAVMR